MRASKVGYQKWAMAIYLMTTNLKGVSSMKLRRDMGVTQKTAWCMARRIREGLDANAGIFAVQFVSGTSPSDARVWPNAPLSATPADLVAYCEYAQAPQSVIDAKSVDVAGRVKASGIKPHDAIRSMRDGDAVGEERLRHVERASGSRHRLRQSQHDANERERRHVPRAADGRLDLRPFPYCFQDEALQMIDNAAAVMLGLNTADPEVQAMLTHCQRAGRQRRSEADTRGAGSGVRRSGSTAAKSQPGPAAVSTADTVEWTPSIAARRMGTRDGESEAKAALRDGKQAERARTREGDRRRRDRVRVKGVKTVVDAVADAATGEALGPGVLVERDSDGFMEWLGDFARDYGGEAMAADDLSAYKPVVERLGIEHQICIAYVKKWARNRLDRIDGWAWGKARIWRLLTELPFGGDLELPRLERMVRDCDSSPPARGAEREVAGAVTPSPAAGRFVDEQRDGAGDRQKQDKVQDCQGGQERGWDAERVWA